MKTKIELSDQEIKVVLGIMSEVLRKEGEIDRVATKKLWLRKLRAAFLEGKIRVGTFGAMSLPDRYRIDQALTRHLGEQSTIE